MMRLFIMKGSGVKAIGISANVILLLHESLIPKDFKFSLDNGSGVYGILGAMQSQGAHFFFQTYVCLRCRIMFAGDSYKILVSFNSVKKSKLCVFCNRNTINSN